MRSITCQCERSFDADLPEVIDIGSEPSWLDEILSGSFLSITCPHCARTLKPELETRFVSKKLGVDLMFLPEAERLSVYRGSVELPGGCEVLIGYKELYERALILRSGFDAEAIEVMKYYVYAKANDSGASSEELLVFFAGKDENGRLKFHIAGLREGELAVLPLPFDRYEKSLADLAHLRGKEPFSRILAGPYKSIRALEGVDS